MNNHPQIAELYKIYKSESQPFRKVHRMIDLFESIIKSHTVLIMTEYVKYNKLSDAAKGLLAQGLRTPSLGTWQLFSRVLFEELEKDNYPWLLPDFAGEFVTLDKALNVEKTNVIAFRNGYAHGATPIDAQCEADIKKFEPFLTQLLESKWLNTSSLEVRDNKVYLVCKAGELTLHPMLLYRKEDAESSFAFFNDLKNDKIGLLNYPLSKHYREKDFFTEFHEHLPLNDWKKTGNNEFYQRIEELTETFKGRTIEREKLLQFVFHNHKGYFSIQGNPGIGKSALIAQFFKDLRSHAEVKKLKVIEYFIRRGTQQAQVEYMFNYLIRRTDEVFPAGKEIRAEGKMVFDFQSQLFAKWRLWGEQANGQQLLFLIDGLDEGVENNVVTYLPRENFDNILIIYGSRPGGHKTIDDLWATLPVENHSKLELSGLGKEDIRALIYEVANKYEVERESAWIDAVQKRSQGNPLYLKLLCDAIENGSIELNDINALPEKIDEYYKAILQRYAQDTVDGDALLAGLFTFAAAKDYLSMAHLGLINKLGSATVQRIGSNLKEVLYENPLTEEVLDYQLFHESFREYLVKEKAKEVSDAAGRIIDFCNTWQELEGSWEQRYPLEHYATHLAESKKVKHHETLIDLIYNKAFATEQMKVLKSFDTSNQLFRLALLKASDLNKEDQMLEAALCLVDLKYEEANDAPQIIVLVANGEIDLALKRIESFGGADKEGVKRKFILYMLCLMELTLLDSKDKPFRKSAIEKLLNHLDEQIPPDTSLIEWNDFFPSLTIFLMASEWAKMGLNYSIIYKRTAEWENDWIKDSGPFDDFNFQVLTESARGISNVNIKSKVLNYISTELWIQGKLEECLSVMQESFACALDISDEYHKNSTLEHIAAELARQDKLEESLACARGISDQSHKSRALLAISTELVKQGKLEEALEYALGIIDESHKSRALVVISTELAKQGKIEEAIACTLGISDERAKNKALKDISTELFKQGNNKESTLVMQEALARARNVSDELDKSRDLMTISTELAKQGKVEEAVSVMQESLECVSSICDEFDRVCALKDISFELVLQGKVAESLECARGISDKSFLKSITLEAISTELAKQGKIELALECALGISDEFDKCSTLQNISTELVQQGKLSEALECASGISDDLKKNYAIRNILDELTNQRKLEEATSVLKEVLECTKSISFESNKSSALKNILAEFAIQGNVTEALECVLDISDEYHKNSTLEHIAVELARQDKLEESLACASGISDEYHNRRVLESISNELAKQGKIEEALDCALGIIDESYKSRALVVISTELAKQGKIEEALACARSISDESLHGSVLADISANLAEQEKIEEAALVIQEALVFARGISDEFHKSRTMNKISSQLFQQDKLEEATLVLQEALVFAHEIIDDFDNTIILEEISTELVQQGKLEEALACARSISDESLHGSVLKAISTELAKKGKFEEALKCARGISVESYKSRSMKCISIILGILGKLEKAEKTGLEITQIALRYSCWSEMSKSIKEQHGWQVALDKVQKLQNEEARLFYLKGWAENLNINETDNTCLKESLPLLAKDTNSIENLLQNYALYELMFGKPTKELMHRLNKCLNVQWAIDITAKFPKESRNSRLTTNIEEWLREIEDEDDQEQVMLWAKQVAKGKITEEEFQVKINTL